VRKNNLESLVIKPAFPRKGWEPVFGGQLSIEERSRLLARIEARPFEFRTGAVNLSTIPVWSEKDSDRGAWCCGVSRRCRRFVVVMPGGLARVSASLDTQVVSMQRGGGSKDTWVLSESPVDSFTMRRPQHLPGGIESRGTSALPSRAADHVYWLGRYAERSEISTVLRCILMRLSSEAEASGMSQGIRDAPARVQKISA